MIKPTVRIGREISVLVVEDMLGSFEILELYEQARLANVGMQRIKRLHFVELSRTKKRVGDRETRRDRRMCGTVASDKIGKGVRS